MYTDQLIVMIFISTGNGMRRAHATSIEIHVKDDNINSQTQAGHLHMQSFLISKTH